MKSGWFAISRNLFKRYVPRSIVSRLRASAAAGRHIALLLACVTLAIIAGTCPRHRQLPLLHYRCPRRRGNGSAKTAGANLAAEANPNPNPVPTAQYVFLPSDLPTFKWHLTARPWTATNITKNDYLAAIDGEVNYWSGWVTSTGSLTDPYQYSAPNSGPNADYSLRSCHVGERRPYRSAIKRPEGDGPRDESLRFQHHSRAARYAGTEFWIVPS